MTSCWLGVLLALSAVALPGASEPDLEPRVRAVLTRYLRFGATELTELDRGRVVRHTLDAHAPGEIAVAGAIRVNAPKMRLLDRARDIVQFKRGQEVLQIGRFSNPPTLDDLASLTVDARDFDPRSCRIRDCDIRLPAKVIEQVMHLNSEASDLQARAALLFKQVLLDNINAYLSGASGRIAQFDDDPKPIRPVDEFNSVLREMPAIGELVPGLPDHLKSFPEQRLAGAEDFLYWSKEKFGIAPFITVTHVTIACQSSRTCVMTTKDVYSSRYIDASLSVTVASDFSTSPKAFYLVYANRSRASALKGRFSALRRSIAERRARGSLDDSLKALKIQLEQGD
jgi:hypothetical protein